MSKSILKRAAAVAAAGALVAVGSFMAVSPAQAAAHLGSATLSPASGGSQTTISVSTEGACNSTATRVRARAFGFGFPAAGQVVVPQGTVGFSTSSPMNLALSNTFQAYATSNSATYLDGPYQIRVECTTNTGVVTDDYRAVMTWTTPGNTFANIALATYTSVANPNIATTTTLTTGTVSPQEEPTYGGTVNTGALTATVNAGGSPVNAAGSVEFFRGAVSLGSAPVNASGVATLPGVSLAVGTYALSANYSGTLTSPTPEKGYGPSVGNASFVVTAKPAGSTTVALAPITPVTTDDNASLSATVTPQNVAGTVQFFRGGTTSLGTVNLTAAQSGTATLSSIAALPAGTYSITAVWTPADAVQWNPSTSAAADLVVSAVTIADGQEEITATVPVDNTLTLSTGATANDRRVSIPLTLDSNGFQYNGTGTLAPITIVDRRPGSLGWNVSANLTPFKQGSTATIAAANLGWDPRFLTSTNSRLNYTEGAAVAAPAAALAASAAPWDRQLAQAPAGTPVTGPLAGVGSSLGTTRFTADLTLVAPTTTAVGNHIAKMTLTFV